VTRHVSARPAYRWLVALVLATTLLSGCGATSGPTGDAASSPPDGPSWIVASRGSPTPSVTPAVGTAVATPVPTGFLPLVAAKAAGTPTPTCAPNSFQFSRIAGVDVTPSARTAVLSWYNVGGYNLVEFRLYAISQDLLPGAQRDVGFVTVRPAGLCGQMTGTITNLSPKTAYVFSVDAVVLRKSGNGSYAATIARSGPITTS
jgi:hypothetical protein